MTDCPAVPVGVAASMDAADKAMRQREVSDWREAFRAGADLGDLLVAARPHMDVSGALELNERVGEAETRMTAAVAAEREAMAELAAMEREWAACSHNRWNAQYRLLKMCRAEVRKLEAEVLSLREFLEPLARRAGARISSVGQWPVEGA